ncbi:uncharacterized protein CIMG_03551 [Coccidioides immitis RS]|uniref:Uncharacterized protein n=3 Tax=Coccidioides immitis TaxID=5501 RepID=J3KBL7_COCIM|nr:uncharacterized protein CIMG_03551 [Coccidioides immitis RS]EAS32527.3 hypothetical protein CIMG_03551 [Coccidioides immitis RS]KMP07767.1 hypothetical protein CIRG_07448 [Coccidioides immitis RMSCC 2394]KMU71776.1 hypothetical protein CISG_00086 [Coccidioides immitis RMSCC 3703]
MAMTGLYSTSLYSRDGQHEEVPVLPRRAIDGATPHAGFRPRSPRPEKPDRGDLSGWLSGSVSCVRGRRSPEISITLPSYPPANPPSCLRTSRPHLKRKISRIQILPRVRPGAFTGKPGN